MAGMVLTLADVSVGRVLGRQRLGWMDGVRLNPNAIGGILMMVKAARKIGRVESPVSYVDDRV